MKIYFLLLSLILISCRQQWEPKKIVIDNLAAHKVDVEGYNLNPDKTPELIESYDQFKKRVVYPDYEKAHRIQGKVLVMAYINDKGKVQKAGIILGIDSALNKSALDAVYSTKFYPALIDGKPVKAKLPIPILFVLDDYKIGENLMHAGTWDYPRPYADYIGNFTKAPDPIGGMNAILKMVVYPKEELKNKIEGKVYISVLIDENGNVKNAFDYSSVNSSFVRAASEAIKKVKFKPAENYGAKVKSKIIIPVQFRLN